ncbi:MAG: TolC family protein [Bacteroidales bacterium]|nr:TolC family protein [Bacteroidales bacterium]
MKRILFILILRIFVTQLPAQECWSLEECIRYGMEHNLDLQAQDIEITARKGVLRQKVAAHFPVIQATVGQEFNWGRSVDMQELVIIRNKLTKATGASLSASLPLFDGFTRHYARLAAHKSVEEATLDAQSLKRSLTVDITRAYLQLMLSRQIHACARESHAAIVQQRERTARLVEAGSQPKSALNEMDAQVAAEKAAFVEAGCQVRTAVLTLGRLMNLIPEDDFPTDDTFREGDAVRPVPLLTSAQVEDWLWRDPRIRSAKTGIEAMEYRHSAAKGAFLPSLRLAAGYGTYYSSAAEGNLRTQFGENRNPSLSFQLVFPLFDALGRYAQARQARLDLDQARLNAARVKMQVEEEIRSAAIEADNCCQRYLSAEETLQAMQELLSVTEAKYNLGAASAFDYIVARNQHAKARSDFLQAKWQYLFQLKLLEYYRQ